MTDTLDGKKRKHTVGYTDADYLGDQRTHRLTIGLVLMLNDRPISWYSKKKNSVALSTTDSELIYKWDQ